MILDGFTGFEPGIPVVPVCDDVIQLLARSKTTHTPTFVAGQAKPGSMDYNYATQDAHNDPRAKSWRLTQWSCAVLAAVVALAALLGTPTAGAQTRPLTPPRRVLFIGNSYTYVNNLPEMLRAMAAARGKTLDVEMATTGGWKLSDHWTTADSDAHRLLRDRKWDVVVLQEQSTFGSTLVRNGVARVGADDQFQRYAKMWQEEIRRAGTTPAFYLTWAKKGAPDDQAVLDRAYIGAARAAHGLLVPVGRAWQGAREHHAGIELFQPDGSHPSPAGTYLAACTFFAAFFDSSPIGLPAAVTGAPIDQQTARPIGSRRETLVNLSAGDAAALQREAWAAWQNFKRSP